MNKDLFLKLFQNKILNTLIFKDVHLIHLISNNLSQNHSVVVDQQQSIYKWKDLLDRPDILVIYNYFNQLKDYIEMHKDKMETIDDIILCRRISSAVCNCIKFDRMHILEYFVSINIFRPGNIMYYYISSQSDSPLHVAARKGSRSYVNYLNKIGLIPTQVSSAVNSAVESLDLDFIKWFINLYYNEVKYKMYDFLLQAINCKSVEIVKWFLDENVSTSNNNKYILSEPELTNIWIEAVRSESIDILNLIFSVYQNPININRLIPISIGGSLEVLKWLILNKTEQLNGFRAITECTRNGNVDTVLCLHKYLPPAKDFMFYSSNPVEWFCMNFILYVEHNDTNIIDHLIIRQNLDLIKWVHENRFSTTVQLAGSSDALSRIISSENMKMFKWFNENRTEGFSTDSMNSILGNTELNDMVKWLLKNRVEPITRNIWDTYLCRQSPDWEMIEWLMEFKKSPLGYRINIDTCSRQSMYHAIKTNNMKSVEWINENSNLFKSNNYNTAGAAHYVFYNNSIEMLEWLYENSKEMHIPEPMGMGMFEQSKKSIQEFIVKKLPNLIPLEILEFYGENFEMFKYIIYNHPQFIDMKSLITASKFGSLEMFKYIHNDHISQTWKDKADFVFSDKLLNCYLESLYYAMLKQHQDIIQFIRDNAPMPEKMEYSKQTIDSLCIKLNHLSDNFNGLDIFD